MRDLTYPPTVLLGKALIKALDIRLRIEGAEHIPRTGGAVLVSNHVSYLDFIFCGYAALPAKRLVRFMAKEEVFRHRIAGPLMRSYHHIPVDRTAGAGSFRAAVAALRAGEVVGVFPEATISRSFTVKETKRGALRLAASADVPLVPMAVWGGHRLWTKGRPRHLLQRHVPVLVVVGEPLHPRRSDDRVAGQAQLHARMQE